LTHPVERLVVEPALVNAAAVPVDWAWTPTVVSVVTTRWLPWVVTSPRISTCRPKTNAE
jgi:hypothetical protein